MIARITPTLRTTASTTFLTHRYLTTSRISTAAMKPVQLYTAGTPNGQKVSIMLEEIKALNPSFEYETHAIDMSRNEQKEDWFLKMNPNGRIPTLLDPNNTATHPDGFPVMESMAILLYLEKKYDDKHVFSWSDSDPKGENYRNQVLQVGISWLLSLNLRPHCQCTSRLGLEKRRSYITPHSRERRCRMEVSRWSLFGRFRLLTVCFFFEHPCFRFRSGAAGRAQARVLCRAKRTISACKLQATRRTSFRTVSSDTMMRRCVCTRCSKTACKDAITLLAMRRASTLSPISSSFPGLYGTGLRASETRRWVPTSKPGLTGSRLVRPCRRGWRSPPSLNC